MAPTSEYLGQNFQAPYQSKTYVYKEMNRDDNSPESKMNRKFYDHIAPERREKKLS